MVPWNSITHEKIFFALLKAGVVDAKCKGVIRDNWPEGEVPTLRALGDQLNKLIKIHRFTVPSQSGAHGQSGSTPKAARVRRPANAQLAQSPPTTPMSLSQGYSGVNSSFSQHSSSLSPTPHVRPSQQCDHALVQSVLQYNDDHINVVCPGPSSTGTKRRAVYEMPDADFAILQRMDQDEVLRVSSPRKRGRTGKARAYSPSDDDMYSPGGEDESFDDESFDDYCV